MLDERRIADRAIAALAGATDRQLVVSNDASASSWFPTLTVVADPIPGLGPLAGIETALHAAEGAAVIVVAWDMPYVTTPLLRGMRALGETGATAVVPAHGDPVVVEPLCAYYAHEALAACTRLLAAGERRAVALFESLGAAVSIPEHLLQAHGDPSRLFLSVDSMEQLEGLGGAMPRR